jgi:bifunctional ADP-heptose synthase (sugar kinase/adenylyltransferase)
MNTQPQKKFNILVVGDSCTDIYQYGIIDKLSPEAPVPIFKKVQEEVREGMASNVRNNLTALGCNVHLLTGDRSTKTRLIDTKSKQHIVRIDDDVYSKALDSIPGYYYDAIVFSDYDKGFVSYDLITDTIRRFKGPVFVDTKKKDLARIGRAIIKINAKEYEEAETLPGDYSDLIVTSGDKGATWCGNYFPAPVVEVSDVCGAGDTFLASLVFKYLETNSINQSIPYAIKAAAITVRHLGVYAPTLEEIG